MDVDVFIEPSLRQLFPDLELGILRAGVNIAFSDKPLKDMVDQFCISLSKNLNPEKIRSMPAIEATKKAIRKLGKDPNRYRPSAESLLRRTVSGKKLYYVNNVVDVMNFISLKTGVSICGYDTDAINGNIKFGIAEEGEPYEGIGRGILNIGNLPVFRDENGPFGTPVSDSVRTSITEHTHSVMVVFPSFYPVINMEEIVQLSADILDKYVPVSSIIKKVID